MLNRQRQLALSFASASASRRKVSCPLTTPSTDVARVWSQVRQRDTAAAIRRLERLPSPSDIPGSRARPPRYIERMRAREPFREHRMRVVHAHAAVMVSGRPDAGSVSRRTTVGRRRTLRIPQVYRGT